MAKQFASEACSSNFLEVPTIEASCIQNKSKALREQVLICLKNLMEKKCHPYTNMPDALFNFYKTFVIYLTTLSNEFALNVKDTCDIFEDRDEIEVRIQTFKIVKYVLEKIGIKYLTYINIYEHTKETMTTLKAIQHYMQVIERVKPTAIKQRATVLNKMRAIEELKVKESHCKNQIEIIDQAVGRALDRNGQEREELDNINKLYEKLQSEDDSFKMKAQELKAQLAMLIKENKLLDVKMCVEKAKNEEFLKKIVSETEMEFTLERVKTLKAIYEETSTLLQKNEEEAAAQIKLQSYFNLLKSKLKVFDDDFECFRVLYELDIKIVDYSYDLDDEYYESRIEKSKTEIETCGKREIALEGEFELKKKEYMGKVEFLVQALEEMLTLKQRYFKKYNELKNSCLLMEERAKNIMDNNLAVDQSVQEARELITNIQTEYLRFFQLE